MATVKIISQEWLLCPYEWGLDDYIILQSNNGLLILCDVQMDVETGQITYRPVRKSNMKIYKGEARND